jgi:hypothetical protein
MYSLLIALAMVGVALVIFCVRFWQLKRRKYRKRAAVCRSSVFAVFRSRFQARPVLQCLMPTRIRQEFTHPTHETKETGWQSSTNKRLSPAGLACGDSSSYQHKSSCNVALPGLPHAFSPTL